MVQQNGDSIRAVSVIMGAYNAGSRIRKAVSSIQEQTLTNWELIVCDDCSSDRTYEELTLLAREDARIVVLHNNENLGLARTLNRCIEHSQGEYIARMDDDDYSLSDRLEKQVVFLKEHPEYGFVSSAVISFDGRSEKGVTHPEPEPTERSFLWSSPFNHPATVFRRDVLLNAHGYIVTTGNRRVPEDYELFMRLYSMGYKGYNLPEPLLRYFVNPEIMKRKRKYRHRYYEAEIRYKGYKELGLLPKGFLYVIKPLLAGLIPKKILYKYHMLKFRNINHK